MTYKLREKYKDFINKEGGIFTARKRKRLLRYSPGRKGYSQEPAQFRYDVRRFVQQALMDLLLFLDTANEKDIKRVISAKSLQPVIVKLLWNPVIFQEEPDQNKAEIANLLIHYGYNYLRHKSPYRLTDSDKHIVSQAMSLSKHLTQYFKPKEEQRFTHEIRWS